MKKLRWLSFAVMGALACTLASCSDDEPKVNSGGENTGDFYATITLKLPTVGSRAGTITPPGTDPNKPGENPSQSTDGYEVGQEDENNVGSIQVVLAELNSTSGKYTFITSATGVPQKETGETQPTFLLQFQSDNLSQSLATGKILQVFAFCNYATTITSANFDNGNITETLPEEEGGGTSENPIRISIAKANSFLMTNAQLVNQNVPAWSQLVKENNTPKKAFDLGTVPVERVACRFDFQATDILKGPDNSTVNIYPIYPNGDNTKPEYARIALTDMALFNEEKEFYLLRHAAVVGNDNTFPSNITLCGIETPDNYVLSPDYALKQDFTGTALPAGLESNFFYPIKTIAANATWTPLGTPSIPDNDNSSAGLDPWPSSGTDYKIWRYATENTIPAPVSLQKNGITTGVVFRGELLAVADPPAGVGQELKTAIENHEPIYAYRDGLKEEGFHQNNKSNLNISFGNAMAAWRYAKSQNNEIRLNIANAIRAGVFKLYADEEKTTPITVSATTSEDVIFGDAVKAVVGEITANASLKAYNLVCYKPTQDSSGHWHYYNYYYYFNYHNNNNNNSVMGPMEFATVRNNIYKLKVENITSIGLPEDTPPDPWTPDEDPEVYFQVKVRVLDWVVRINNINF